MKPSLVTQDFTEKFKETIKRFKHDAVLVGIPETDASRNGDEQINNATLLAINHFGSPGQNIPARPVLSIGIKLAQNDIADQFKACAKSVFNKGLDAIEIYYERAGTIAASAVKKVITDQTDIAPPADSTLKARKYLTKTGFKGEKSLLVTGQMRNAITYVVNKWGS